MCTDASTDHVPLLVQVCCGVIEDRGLGSVGIYRVPGNSAAVVALTEQVRASAYRSICSSRMFVMKNQVTLTEGEGSGANVIKLFLSVIY
jgi:hypothetical protein